jgi:hypothetical protein
VGRFTQRGSRHGGIALGHYLSLRWSFEMMTAKDLHRFGALLKKIPQQHCIERNGN